MTLETPLPQLAKGTTLADRYEILGELGKGGMGEVYLAEDTNLKRRVAIKVLHHRFALDKERLVRFEREARLLASLNHPNIATIHGLEKSDDQQFLVMELVEGETLHERISKGPLPFEDALEICKQIAEGLESAHEKGIIHRDLKPANVKVTPDGKVKILDFGIAKAFQHQPDGIDPTRSPSTTDGMTKPGVLLGTVAYMSPEQSKGKAVDKRTDIWAFGCILFECLTGKRPFEGETTSESIALILKGEPDWAALPKEIPIQTRLFLFRYLQKDPHQRTHDIADARIEIDEVLQGPHEMAVSEPVRHTSFPLWWRLIPWLAVIVFGLIGIIWLSTSRDHSNGREPKVTRFVLTAPSDKNMSINLEGAGLDLSPDGSQLVYTRAGELCRRQMNQLEPLSISSDAGFPLAPFHSTDGKWVGFFDSSDGKLKKTLLESGITKIICDADSPRGGNWLSDGTIVFGGLQGALWRVSSEGGTPERISQPSSDGSGPSEVHCWPQVLPGAEAVLFTIWKPTGQMKIAVLSLQTGKHEVVIAPGTYARYLPTGHLVYSWKNTLFAVSFDMKQLKVSGNPSSVVQDVLHPFWGGEAYFSVSSTGVLAYVHSGQESKRFIVWLDRKGQLEFLPLPEGDYQGNPRISPDGNRLLILKKDKRVNIYIYDLKRETLQRLTDEQGDEWHPMWMPDGKRVVFNSTRHGGSTGNLYWKSIDTNIPEERLIQSDSWQHPFSSSPDQRLLAFNERGDIWILKLEEEREARPLFKTKFMETCPKFSPVGRWLAYESDESGRPEVYMLPYPVSGPAIPVSTDGGKQPFWARNGKELFYREGNKLMSVAVQYEPGLELGKPKIVFEDNFSIDTFGSYDVTPDGRRFILFRRTKPWEIHIILNWFEELERLVLSRN
jgi:serine/threonine-protein kinase